jgi:hypothetical protein
MEVIAHYLIDTMSRKPIRYSKHLYRQSTDPLKIYQTSNVPLLVDKDITCMEVGKLEIEGSVTAFPLDDSILSNALVAI